MSDTAVDEFLAHYGVKGMKWGVHNTKADFKASRKQVREIRGTRHTTSEIQDSRTRQESRKKQAAFYEDKAKTASSAATAKKYKSLYEKAAKDFDTSDDRIIATKMTTGEQFVEAMFGTGLVGAVMRDVQIGSIDKDIAKKR